MAIGAGAGGFVTRLMVQRDVEALLQNIEKRIMDGEGAEVVQEIRSANPKGDPDIGAFPVLDLLPALNDRLSKSTPDGRSADTTDVASAENKALR